MTSAANNIHTPILRGWVVAWGHWVMTPQRQQQLLRRNGNQHRHYVILREGPTDDEAVVWLVCHLTSWLEQTDTLNPFCNILRKSY